MTRAGAFQSIGSLSNRAIEEAFLRAGMSTPAKRRAEVFLAEVTRRHSVLVVIATGAPEEGVAADGHLFFPRSMLPRLHAAFDLRRIAGRGPSELIIQGVRP